MASSKKTAFSFKVYRGDAKSLLAFNLDKSETKNLAGFTIAYDIGDGKTYYIFNELHFEEPALHAQDPTQPATASINAPIHKFRWVHVPGTLNQGPDPFYGKYTYTATPRYFDGQQRLLAIDRSLSQSVSVEVAPFSSGNLALGFTRGYVQSQGFVHQFGPDATFKPKDDTLLFDTSQVAGKSPRDGSDYTFAQEYEWSGFTARKKVFEVLNDVLGDSSLHLDVFAYDLNEPDVMKALLQLAKAGRVRVILDDAALHHTKTPKKAAKAAKSKSKRPKGPTPEDQFTAQFNKVKTGDSAILRGHFGRYAHDKVFIVSKGLGGNAQLVLSGSTNLSVTGLYVNSNHVLVFNDSTVAKAYAAVFDASWEDGASHAFADLPLAGQTEKFASAKVPETEITFSPHPEAFATQILAALAGRIQQEGNQDGGSVFFAVMDTGQGGGPVLPALIDIHKKTDCFSYGISDSTQGIFLYSPRSKTGVKVTGKPGSTMLPPPFNQVPSIGAGHQIHHKFVVCGFNGKNPVVYCGSSNLALGGEEENGDNLIAIHDKDVATVFTIEALALVDHFDFLDRYRVQAAKGKKSAKTASKSPAKLPTGSKQKAAALAGWFLSTTDKWAAPYFDPKDLHNMDRELFG